MNEQLLDRMPPQDLDAEKGVLGSMILDGDVCDDVVNIINADDFYYEAHQKLFLHIMEMHDTGKNIDPLLLIKQIEKAGELAVVGGKERIAAIATSVPYANNAVYYARIVQENAVRRALIRASSDVLGKAYDMTNDANELLGSSEQAMLSINDNRSEDTIINATNLMAEVFDRLAARESGQAGGSVKSGFRDLDNKTGGLHDSELIILAARPGMGKTAMSLNITEKVVLKEELPVLFISLEMARLELAQRLLCSVGKIDSRNFRNGTLSAQDHENISTAAAEISQAPLFVEDSPARNVSQIGSAARRIKRKHGLALIVIDYLQLLQPDDKSDPRHEQVAKMARRLKCLARELDVPILCLSQLNRESEKQGKGSHRPKLSHLRECVTGCTTLINASGERTRIDNIKPGDYVLGINEKKKTAVGRVADVWNTGVKRVFSVKTKSGREIRCTGNHPLLTFEGWRSVVDIPLGAKVAVSFRNHVHGTNTNKELCRLIGYMAGNGAVQKNRTLGLILPDNEAFKDASDIIKTHWPEISINLRNNQYNDAWLSIRGGCGPGKNPMINWLREIGFHDMKDETKCVPEFIFNGGSSAAAEFLSGYLASDGCVKKRKSGRWLVHFDTTSLQLARDTISLCSRIGVFASIGKPCWSKKSTKPTYRISVCEDAENIIRFSKALSVPGYKGEKLKQAAKHAKTQKTRYSAFSLPKEVSLSAAKGGTWRHQGKSMSRRRCREVAIETGMTDLMEHADSDVIWDQIVAITECGKEETYDISIPGINCFIANEGIVSHNSGAIEQDADVVMFVHREEYYCTTEEEAKEGDHQGRGEVIIAKQRSGPTGTVDVAWLPQYTKFDNLALPTHSEFDDFGGREDVF